MLDLGIYCVDTLHSLSVDAF